MRKDRTLRRWIPLTGLAFLLAALPSAAQRPSPLIYDDPTFEWLDNRDPDSPRTSPNASVGLQLGSTRVMVAYGSPGVKGRRIFGGLVPYDRIWRTGADEATTITLNGDVLVGGQRVAAGAYSLFTIPSPSEWTIILNRKNNQWGAFSHDTSDDVLRLKVKPEEAEFRERFTIGFDDIDTEDFSAVMVLHWDRTKVPVGLAEPD